MKGLDGACIEGLYDGVELLVVVILVACLSTIDVVRLRYCIEIFERHNHVILP